MPRRIEDIATRNDVPERPPPGVEPVPENSDYAVKVARETMESSKAAERAMYGREMRAPATLDVNAIEGRKPTPALAPVMSEAERDAIRERALSNTTNAAPAPAQVDFNFAGACSILVQKMQSLSTEWGGRIEAMKLERHLRDDEICIALMARTLDQGEHMTVSPDHPYFSQGFKAVGSSFLCLTCGNAAERKYPGQPPFCRNECAGRFRANFSAEEQKEILKAAQT
jgi:hypothetical protein